MMQTSFTSIWQRTLREIPQLQFPGATLTLRTEQLREVLFQAFQEGVIHHAETTRELQRQLGLPTPQGPAELATTFEAIFGPALPVDDNLGR